MTRTPAVYLAVCAALLLGFVGLNDQARADFPEEDITFIIPYSPGGGFDTYVRAISPVMEKYLPNGVHVVPRNMPGAGSRKGSTYVYQADPDGYTIGIFNMPGIALPQIKGEQVGFDLKKITWLGRVAQDSYGLAVRGNSDVESVGDLKNLGRTVKLTSTGRSTTAHVVAVVATNALEIDADLITGYKGSRDAILGVIRGDGDGIVMVLGTLDKYVSSGDLRLVASLTESPPMPDVPVVADLGAPSLAKLGINRFVGGPPGLPAERRRVLAGALMKALNDPELQAWSKESGRSINPAGADATQQSLLDQMELFEQYKHLF